jgi:hypothetical protein
VKCDCLYLCRPCAIDVLQDIWSSKDGESWELFSGSAFGGEGLGRGGHAMLLIDAMISATLHTHSSTNYLWIIGKLQYRCVFSSELLFTRHQH